MRASPCFYVLFTATVLTPLCADAHDQRWSYRSCSIGHDACRAVIVKIAKQLRPLYKSLDISDTTVEMEDFQPTVHALIMCDSDLDGAVILVTASSEWPEFRKTIADDIKERIGSAGGTCD